MNERLPRLGLGFVAACTSAVLLYGGLRVAQAALFTEPDPAHVIWSEHAGYFWRCLTVGYAGVMVGFLAYGAARTNPAAVARALVRGLTVAATVIVLQGVFLP